MRNLFDVMRIAVAALLARPVRALLMAVGPLLGVAVIVGAIGVLQSADGELRAALRHLGGNLALVIGADDRLPVDAVERVRSVSTVEDVGGAATVPGVVATTIELPGGNGHQASSLVMTADPELLGVLEVGLARGRALGYHDETASTTAAVIGAGVANAIHLADDSLQILYIGGHPFGIVGVLEESLLAPELNGAVLIPRSTAEAYFGMESGQTSLYVRIAEGAVADTARILPTVVTFGERRTVLASIPTDLLEAQTAIDQTLAGSIVGLGVLAMAVGGFGIANVMMISVLERQREIGVRRALGHPRSTIAAQFLTEGTLIGTLGAGAGVVVGITFVHTIARSRGWMFYLDTEVILGAAVAAMAATVLATLYPTLRAVRIEPLEALRSG